MGWRSLVKGYITNIFISLGVFGFLLFRWFFAFRFFWGFWVYANQPTELCTIGELPRGGSVAVAVGESDRCHATPDLWQDTCDTWHVTTDTWHVTTDTWHLTCDSWQQIFFKTYLFVFAFFGLILFVLVWELPSGRLHSCMKWTLPNNWKFNSTPCWPKFELSSAFGSWDNV